MSIRFFLPEELYELWNLTFFTWFMQTASDKEETADSAVKLVEDRYRLPMDYNGYAKNFLATLLHDYLLTEHIHNKAVNNFAILKRDHFQCQVPGCKCRRNLQVHHIIWRSKGGCDEHWNLITLCLPQTHSSRSDGSEDRRNST